MTNDDETKNELPYDALEVPEHVDMSLVEPVLEHMMHLADGDPVHFEYQLNWWAAVLQNRKKLKVGLIYVGKPGIGVDILVDDLFGRWVLGASFYGMVGAGKLLNLRGESAGGGKLLFLVKELGCTRKHDEYGAFKDAVTGTTLRIEPKGAWPFYVQDSRNFVATTKDAHNVKLGYCRDDHLYLSRASSEWAKGRNHTEEERLRHFSRILGARYSADDALARPATDGETEAVARQLYFYLMRRDISSFVPENYPTNHISIL